MKSASWKLRRRSTGHLPHDMVQQLQATAAAAAATNQRPQLQDRTRSVDLLFMSPIHEHPQIQEQDRNKSKMAAAGTGSGASSKKRKSGLASLMTPVIGSRSTSPIPPKGDSPSGNDSDSLSSRSSISTTPKTPNHPASFSAADWSAPRRGMTYEEELEVRLHKVNAAALGWKQNYAAKHAQYTKVNQLLLEREKEYKSILKSLTAQYDSQITEVRSRLFVALDTADALAEDNKRLNAELRDLQEKYTQETNTLQSRLADTRDETQTLKEEIDSMVDKSRDLESEKLQLVQDNSALKSQIQQMELDLIRTKEISESESWSEYYRVLLDLALDKLRCLESIQVQSKLPPRKERGSNPAVQDSGRTSAEQDSSSLQVQSGSLPMDTRSMDSMTSFESLLSDVTDNMSRKPSVPELDYNDNVTPRGKTAQSSPRTPDSCDGLLQQLADIAHQRQASEPLSSSSGLGAGSVSGEDVPRTGVHISYSEGNLSRGYCVAEEQVEERCNSYPMPTLLEAPSERSLERKRETFIKSYSDDVPPAPNGANVISMSDSNLHNLPVQRVLSDGATEVIKKMSKSPSASPKSKLKAQAKKASKQFNILKRWQAGELERPKFPWRRRHTHDAGVITKQLEENGNTNSLPRRSVHDVASLQEKLALLPQTRSQEDLLNLDNLPHIVVSRSASITSASSAGSVDFDLDPGRTEEVKGTNTVNNTTQSGFERLRNRRNGITDVADGLEMRKSPPGKGGGAKGRDRPKSVDTLLDSRSPTPNVVDLELPATKQKHKFFRKKSRSVKK